jgi:hypothetical protein
MCLLRTGSAGRRKGLPRLLRKTQLARQPVAAVMASFFAVGYRGDDLSARRLWMDSPTVDADLRPGLPGNGKVAAHQIALPTRQSRIASLVIFVSVSLRKAKELWEAFALFSRGRAITGPVDAILRTKSRVAALICFGILFQQSHVAASVAASRAHCIQSQAAETRLPSATRPSRPPAKADRPESSAHPACSSATSGADTQKALVRRAAAPIAPRHFCRTAKHASVRSLPCSSDNLHR